jgi:asparagine synthase (glutamine-hydrolysing)
MPWELPRLLGETLAREALRRLKPLQLIASAMTPDPQTPRARVTALESGLYLRNQLLRDADWAGMAHGVEIRTPLVDARLLEQLAPVLVGEASLEGKALLARVAARPLPDAWEQAPKRGFHLPFDRWLHTRGNPLDAWRRVPLLTEPGCHWSRKLAYGIYDAFGMGGC